ncbi:acyl-CoA Delta12-desaturase [Rhodnius prolixus]|uniref:Fatty acid desaturase domain-containing protein n=1 Tax=Rhodnius prolixus TaxID=13249 RepID=T1H7V5_RHOPR
MSEESVNEENVGPRLSNHWPSVLFQIYLHMSALYGLILVFTQASLMTTLFCILLVFLGTLGITLGSHRLWTHRTYSATLPLRLFLAFCQTLTCQCSIFNWVLHHKVHHKFHGTKNDPCNYRHGFFFCHLSNHCLEANPEIERMKRHISVSDLEDDYVVYFQHWLYYAIMPVIGFLLPVNIGMEYIGETLVVSVFVLGFLRVCLLLHASWLVESAFLLWGLDPSDRKAGDTWLVFFVTKSLWPQYHYLLPWDYRSGEYGTYENGCLNSILRVFAALGMASQLTTISSVGVKEALAKSAKTGEPLAGCLEESKYILPDILHQDPENY